MQHLCPIGKDERQIDVNWPLLRRPCQRREDDLLGLPLDHFQDRRALDPVFREQSLEGGRLKDAESDIKPDSDHDDTQQKRDAPPPDQELIA